MSYRRDACNVTLSMRKVISVATLFCRNEYFVFEAGNEYSSISLTLSPPPPPLIKYAPRGRAGGGGQVSYTFPWRMTCTNPGGGPDNM